MDHDHQHQSKLTKSHDILDSYVQTSSESPEDNSNTSSCCEKRDDIEKIKKKNQNLVANCVSEKEMKIREDLESEIERHLEEEIKDGIYHLALRLHRLYQHQKDKNNLKNGRKILEVNISIKMEGGTKVEIKEYKKEAPDYKDRPTSSSSSRSETLDKQMALLQRVSGRKKFDWANSLRSDAGGSMVVNKRTSRRPNKGSYDFDKTVRLKNWDGDVKF